MIKRWPDVTVKCRVTARATTLAILLRRIAIVLEMDRCLHCGMSGLPRGLGAGVAYKAHVSPAASAALGPRAASDYT
jgi:hypothetical protein